MAILEPGAVTVLDICSAALKEAGVVGVGQSPLAEDLNDAWARLQFMLQEWERKRWLVYHLVNILVTSTGAYTYSVGPGGDYDTGVQSARPDKLESGFLRQLTQSQPNQIDYPLELLQSFEDFNRIALKKLVSFPTYIYYDPGWPLGTLHIYPVPQANIYGVNILIKEQLPNQFANQAVKFNLPYEYYSVMLYNLALRLRPKYGIGTYPGDMVPELAKNSLNVLRGANTAIAQLTMPADLNRPGIYNIFSDRSY